MALEQCVEIDPRLIQLTVVEQWSERRWLRITRATVRKTYTLALRVGRWLDGDEDLYVLRHDPRHERLFGLWAAWRIEQKLNCAIDLPVSRPLLDC